MIDFEKICDFVNSAFGENKILARMTLEEMGIDPDTKQPIPDKKREITIPPGSSIDWLIAAGAQPDQVQKTLDKEAKIREVTQAYEQYMGYSPLDWGKLERLQKFLLTKSVEEIKTFAAWSRKEYSTLTPPKARQYPQLVIDCWNLAFEKPTAENNTKSAIQEAIHGKI